jgi:hypothetical protein
LSFSYGHKYGIISFCQVVNEANGEVAAPDDLIRPQQGWVKLRIRPQIGLQNT